MEISVAILSWSYFSCMHIQRFFLLSYELNVFFQIFVPKVYSSLVLENNSLWTVDIIFINKLHISWKIYFNILIQSEELFSFRKLQKAVQLIYVYLKLVKNKFLSFFHFSDLWNFVKCMDSMCPCYSLLYIKLIRLHMVSASPSPHYNGGT